MHKLRIVDKEEKRVQVSRKQDKLFNFAIAFFIAVIICSIIAFNIESRRMEQRIDNVTKHFQEAGVVGGGLHVRENKRK